MGLFGFGKKKDNVDFSKEFGATPGMPDFNNPQTGQFGATGMTNDPMMDPNSGLKLADLNAQGQDAGFGQQQAQGQAFDSFGNPRPQTRGENFEYKPQQQVAAQDNSKDMQLILAKLDTIRSEITNINHRLDNIERHQQEPQQKKYPW
jgi:hypothetical protein